MILIFGSRCSLPPMVSSDIYGSSKYLSNSKKVGETNYHKCSCTPSNIRSEGSYKIRGLCFLRSRKCPRLMYSRGFTTWRYIVVRMRANVLLQSEIFNSSLSIIAINGSKILFVLFCLHYISKRSGG
jgi:hypothetical protein